MRKVRNRMKGLKRFRGEPIFSDQSSAEEEYNLRIDCNKIIDDIMKSYRYIRYDLTAMSLKELEDIKENLLTEAQHAETLSPL